IAQVTQRMFHEAEGTSVPAFLFVKRQRADQTLRSKPGFFGRHAGADIVCHLLLKVIAKLVVKFGFGLSMSEAYPANALQFRNPAHDSSLSWDVAVYPKG